MQLLGVVATLLIISSATAEDTTLSTAVPYPVFANSVVIAFPGCTYTGQKALLTVTNNANNSDSRGVEFIVPQCRLKRDLIVLDSSASSNTQAINVGYQFKSLSPGTSYTAYYTIAGNKFTNVSFTTLGGTGDAPVVFARSGGMVVITVLLSIAMCLLLLLLIVTLILGGGIKK